MQRRGVLATGLAAVGWAAVGCSERALPLPPAAWVGASHERGHRLRADTGNGGNNRGNNGASEGASKSGTLPPPALRRTAAVVIVGAGIAGLAAARAFARQGIDDVQLLELEDSPGGNSRGHSIAGMACPLGAHYLPVPDAEDPAARDVVEWLHDIGLLHQQLGRSVPDERHLCHSPQERLFIDGAWQPGLLPAAAPGSPQQQQQQRLSAAIAALQVGAGGRRAFTLPAHRGAWTAAHAALNGISFAHWLDRQDITDTRLRWYLDYCCRDDYGAPAGTVSAAAGVAYFASRHGFQASEAAAGPDTGHDAVFTWPDGNAWLVRQLAEPFSSRIHAGRTVLRVTEGRHGVQLLAWDETRQQVEAWSAAHVVLALPLFVAARVLESPPPALQQAAGLLTTAPWLVANLHIDRPLLDRIGAPPCWDNVVYGSSALGYVDAMHQSLRPVPGASVLTAYRALPHAQRHTLLADGAGVWAGRVLQDLAVAHPDLPGRVQRVDLMRWGHAMAVPAPGVLRHPALLALRRARGRVRFAHSDLAGYSVFEEAFTAGTEVASPLASTLVSAGAVA